ncbi:MAG: hypothetical protein DMG35_19835 [Acidobacteria bacterium]|nr:MAG: hypothetical protein DMG35_19835 [Acidobacteriota bacterium]
MDEQQHYWVVTCKNVAYHQEKNPFALHRIRLAKTEVGARHRDHVGRFSVMCDDCGKQFTYEAPEVIMWIGPPVLFMPHPLFA